MSKHYSLSLILILSFSFLQINCKDEPTIPPDNKPPLGKRNYTWSVDTISYPGSFQTLMYDIWGSSPNDVYVVGHNESPPGPGTIFRFNGSTWNAVKFHIADGGNIQGAISLRGIFSFSQSDVWVVGGRLFDNPNKPPSFLDSSLIIHYNGIGWHEHKVEGDKLFAVWGTDSSNIFFGGFKGSLFRGDGVNIYKDLFPSHLGIALFTGNSASNIYSYCYSQNTPSYNAIYRYNGMSWSIVDSTKPFPSFPHFGNSAMWFAAPDILYSCGYGGVYQKKDSGWVNVLKTGAESITSIRGNAGNNLFAVGKGQVYHFNGEGWFKYEQFSDQNILWYRAWSDGNVVFIIGQTLTGIGRTIVLRGK